MPFFSVIIATRNRPALFGEALESVLIQSCENIEIIVVNDGSDVEHKSEYDLILNAAAPGVVRAFALPPTQKGHGGSYVRNFGAARAAAPYLCFLDDDDCWIDRDHLARAQAVISDPSASVDLYMTNQVAFLHGKQRPDPIWLEDLPPILARFGNCPDRHGAYTLTVDELLKSRGFCHLNTLIVRRPLYEKIGGMAEAVRWEHDRDLYLRLIDRASGAIKYMPITVSRHNLPDPTQTASITTALSPLERLLDQLLVLDRALSLSHHPAIRSYARRYKAYTLKRMAELFARTGRNSEAAEYARKALRVGPTAKWTVYTAWLSLRALLAVN